MLLPAIMALCGLAAFTLNSIKNKRLYFVGCLLVISLSFVNNYNDRRPPDREPVDYCKRMFSSIPSKAMVLMSNDVEFRPYYYLRLTQNFRPDVGIQLVDAIEARELSQFDYLLRSKKVSGVFSTLVYPVDAAHKLIASFSLPVRGYAYRIARKNFPEEHFIENKNSRVIELKDSKLFISAKPANESDISQGEALTYSYNFSGTTKDFKNLRALAFLSDKKGNKIYRHNLLVGHDCHSPVNFVARSSIASKNKISLNIKRSLIIPFDLKPGDYKLNFCFQIVKPDEIVAKKNTPVLEGVNLFNLNGFLEVFKLNYGLSQRKLLDKDMAEGFESQPAEVIPLKVKVSEYSSQ
jgi:hypothetical protein